MREAVPKTLYPTERGERGGGGEGEQRREDEMTQVRAVSGTSSNTIANTRLCSISERKEERQREKKVVNRTPAS